MKEIKVQIDANDLQAIYICLNEYALIVEKQNPEGAAKINNTRDKIWNQSTKELKEMIHPDRYDREKWINALDDLPHHQDGH